VPANLHRTLEDCAKRSGLSTVGLVRVILEETLAGSPATVTEALRSQRSAADVVALSALVASEHAVKLFEVATPGGTRFSREARALAYEAAEQRLHEIRQHIEEGG
jgi:hypothetical protein